MAKEDVIRLFRFVQVGSSLKEALNAVSNLEALTQMAQERGMISRWMNGNKQQGFMEKS